MELLKERGIYSGIKLDKGLVVMGGTDGETAVQGLDGLAERAKAFYEKGCRFGKWRATLKIGNGIPSPSKKLKRPFLKSNEVEPIEDQICREVAKYGASFR